jgi:C4-dicarboxylate-specific signal transduction histidine kinase
MQAMVANKKIRVSSRISGGDAIISVADSGPGVAAEVGNKVFDPFYTTKNDGTGIGLSLCHRIASDHLGSLVMRTGKLGGAEFQMVIPVRKDQLING